MSDESEGSVRLQKFLAECGLGSRRNMEIFISEGRVRVNGKTVTEMGFKVNPGVDRIEVNRKLVKSAPKGVMLLNKPRGVVSTLDDPEGRRTIADFLTKQYLSYFPVGRLDFDSTGLMILTNDGDLAERLMHPRYEFERTYHARVEGHLNAELLAKLPRGIRLSDGMVHGSGEIIKNDEKTTWVEVKVREGRNRVVRRLFEKLGHAVMKLKRLTYGPFKLGKLQVGQIRVLTQEEYMLVRHKVLTSVGGETEKKAKKPGRETGATRAAGPGREGQKGRATTERPKSRPRRGSSQRRRRE